MQIHRDHNGVTTLAIIQQVDGSNTAVDVTGHKYQVLISQLTVTLDFQHGPVKEVGVNGLTNEALLAILIHRTEWLNNQFPCAENETALQGMRQAREAFESRTRDRLARQVEGKNEA